MTEFVNFINASGMSKMTIVSNAKLKHEESEGNPYDYWKDFKDAVKKQLKRGGSKDDLSELLESVREEVYANYQEMIKGFNKFWKPNSMEWLKPANRMATISGVKMNINPEIGVVWNDKKFMIKMFIKAKENLDKRHADIILALMENELRVKVDDDIVFAILDVRRGKLFSYVNNDPRLLVLARSEGRSFAEMWKEL